MKDFRVGYQLFVNVGFINKSVCTVSSVKAELSVSFIIKLDKGKGSVVLGVLFEIITVDAAALDGFNQKFTRKIISDLESSAFIIRYLLIIITPVFSHSETDYIIKHILLYCEKKSKHFK